MTTTSTPEATPAANLQDLLLSRVWRTATSTTSDAIQFDFGSSTPIGMVALFGTNLTAAADIVVKLSNTNSTGDGTVHTSSTLNTADTTYRSFVYFLTAASARYVRIEISDSSLSFLEAGRLVIGNPFTPTYGLAFGLSRGYERAASLTRSAGGQQWLTVDYNQQVWAAEFRALTEAETNANFAAIQQYSGQFKDILICRDTASSSLPRDTIFGTIDNPHAIRAQEAGAHDIVFQVRERL